MSEELYKGLWKYKLEKRYDVAKRANDSRLNEGRDYTNDLMSKGLSGHIVRNNNMANFVRFIQDLFVNSVRTVTQLKLYKAFAMPKDYLKVK